MIEEDTRSQQAILNDQFRKKSVSGIIITVGIRKKIKDTDGLIDAIRNFNYFDEDDGDHDFGSLEWEDKSIFWKIDYYNSKLDDWEDPLLGSCKRIMTIMLSHEY